MGVVEGRLGLDTARVPQADRHGLLWLARGNLTVSNGTLHFATVGSSAALAAGLYEIPFQTLNCILLGPGSTVSHDALRLLARHGTGLVAVGEDAVRMYAAMPFGPNDSALARRQVVAWSDAEGRRIQVARKMYAWRLSEVFPRADIAVLRGIEGARMKEAYARIAQEAGIEWGGRRYDRQDPTAADIPNQAINHAATALEAAAMVAVSIVGAIPQLGFIHEDASQAFCLDLADLYRTSVTVPVAFLAARQVQQDPQRDVERTTRQLAGRWLRDKKVIADMIDKIKEMFPEGSG
jgi:CRISPR-associated protein Cas1